MNLSGKTDIGKARKMNQDTFCCGRFDDTSCYAVVCDGMGGHNAGNIASELACEVIGKQIAGGFRADMNENLIRDLLMSSVAAANAEVYERSKTDEELFGMGTTVVAAILNGSLLHVAHVGDSRAYIVNSGEFAQITRDHSIVQELLEAGKISDEDARNHPQKNLITRAVGVNEQIQVDYLETVLNREDRVLICSDGLTNACTEEEIHRIVADTPVAEIPQMLIDRANEHGGMDNITVVVIAE